MSQVMTEETIKGKNHKSKETAKAHGKCMLTRRQFMMYSSSATVAATTISISLFPGTAEASVNARANQQVFAAELKSHTNHQFPGQ